MSKVDKLKSELNKLANPTQKAILQSFFKTGSGQYAEGDIFLGIKVPQTRAIAKQYYDLAFKELQILLDNKIHEYRLSALIILSEQYKKGNEKEKKSVFDFYLANTKNINNWDLVDISAPKIIGEYLKDKDRKILYKLTRSKNIWERRIAIVATFTFIRNNDFFDTLLISELLLNDTHDLINKACGWMLREVGKKDQQALELFLKKFKNQMPRVMLRYAIEKFPDKIRKEYLKK